jgi:hypothetical protein
LNATIASAIVVLVAFFLHLAAHRIEVTLDSFRLDITNGCQLSKRLTLHLVLGHHQGNAGDQLHGNQPNKQQHHYLFFADREVAEIT